MTKKTRNETILLVIILLITGILIYYYFFGNKPSTASTVFVNPTASDTATSSSTAPLTTGTNTAVATNPTAANPAASSAANTSTAATAPNTSDFLPNGAQFDTQVLSNQVFQTLVAPVYPTVGQGDVGVSNPFVNQTAVAAQSTPAPKK
jgi:cytoskeletal protein RodZ